MGLFIGMQFDFRRSHFSGEVWSSSIEEPQEGHGEPISKNASSGSSKVGLLLNLGELISAYKESKAVELTALTISHVNSFYYFIVFHHARFCVTCALCVLPPRSQRKSPPFTQRANVTNNKNPRRRIVSRYLAIARELPDNYLGASVGPGNYLSITR